MKKKRSVWDTPKRKDRIQKRGTGIPRNCQKRSGLKNVQLREEFRKLRTVPLDECR